MKISILGAAGTGKSALAVALTKHLRNRACSITITVDPAGGGIGRTVRMRDGLSLTSAVGGELAGDDPSRQEDAIAIQRGYDLTLLCGLDFPTPHEQQTGPMLAWREQVDAGLRAALQQYGIAYGVVYGTGEQRLTNALRFMSAQAPVPVRWHGLCEKCSDPDCELRLFTALKNSQAAAHPAT